MDLTTRALATSLMLAWRSSLRGGSNSCCGLTRKMDWKTKWLIYYFYARCNVSTRRFLALFDINMTLVPDIVYTLANVLCTTLPNFFPMPTESQLLRAYPKSVIKKFDHENIMPVYRINSTRSSTYVRGKKIASSHYIIA